MYFTEKAIRNYRKAFCKNAIFGIGEPKAGEYYETIKSTGLEIVDDSKTFDPEVGEIYHIKDVNKDIVVLDLVPFWTPEKVLITLNRKSKSVSFADRWKSSFKKSNEQKFTEYWTKYQAEVAANQSKQKEDEKSGKKPIKEGYVAVAKMRDPTQYGYMSDKLEKAGVKVGTYNTGTGYFRNQLYFTMKWEDFKRASYTNLSRALGGFTDEWSEQRWKEEIEKPMQQQWGRDREEENKEFNRKHEITKETPEQSDARERSEKIDSRGG